MPTTVISERLWREAFNSDPAVLGRAVGIGGRFFTIVGITPAGFAGLRIRDIGGNRRRLPATVLVFLGISPADPQAVLSTVGVLALAALIASAVPAYRAATVEPTVALRED